MYVLDGASFAPIATIDFGDDVDNLRYDEAESRVYVGFGEGKPAAIGMVDAKTNQRLPREYKTLIPSRFSCSTREVGCISTSRICTKFCLSIELRERVKICS